MIDNMLYFIINKNNYYLPPAVNVAFPAPDASDGGSSHPLA